MTTRPFGKHAGRDLADLPGDYLAWLAGTDLREPLRSAVTAELQARGQAAPVPARHSAPTPAPDRASMPPCTPQAPSSAAQAGTTSEGVTRTKATREAPAPEDLALLDALREALRELHAITRDLAGSVRVFTSTVERLAKPEAPLPAGHWTRGVEPTEAGAELLPGDPL